MRPEIRQLFDIIAAPEYDNLRNTEIIQLSCVLEISNGRDANSSEYQIFLSDIQLKIRLSVEEQYEIVHELLKIVDRGHSLSSSLIFTIGKATADVIINLFQDFFLNNYAQMDNELIYQSIIALENGCATRDKNILSKLKFAELNTMFEVLAHSSDERISKHSQYWI